MKTKIVFIQLGSPKSPNKKDVKVYLREFLGDPRVVDLNPLAWKFILNFFVLPFRPKFSAKLYSRIWDGEKFPLIENTRLFSEKVSSFLSDQDDIEVEHCYILSKPRISELWDKWDQEKDEYELFLVPLFPQYSESTSASVYDSFSHEALKRANIPSHQFLQNFHRSKAFIDNSVKSIKEKCLKVEEQGTCLDKLIISFHGIPKRRVIYKNDPYYKHCCETFILIKKGVQKFSKIEMEMTFQSRLGSEEWLTPYTDERVEELVVSGIKDIAVYCPSFVSDCLETIDEIGYELQKDVSKHGGTIHFVECLNDNEAWCNDFSEFLMTKIRKDNARIEQLEYNISQEDMTVMETPTMTAPPLTKEAKSSLKIVFFTLFLDLVGFSIIFPLFPALAEYYLTVDSENIFLKAIFGVIDQWTMSGGVQNFSNIVLFGGALGALYSLLQFIAAPIWGEISDRIGRRPVLLVSVSFLALSYLLWFFSGSFTLLIIARIVGGIMGGNISTATAVVADVTVKENRSRGMATIGIAFALGFIIGPAMGGIMSLIDLSTIYPELVAYGVNPFSMPALLAFVLSVFNVYFIWRKFEETLPESKRGKHHSLRSNNPFKLFKPLPFPGVNLTNIGHFLFLMAFSGMEFTLTFLAVERLSYNSLDNAYMFIFIGFVLAIVQGGIVRRKAHSVGEKKMAIIGMISLIPGLLLISYTQTNALLYAGLFFLAVGASMVIPCLTSLVSLYSPAEQQGRAIGVFRSLGALARVLGPVAASIVYWKFGSDYPYILGAIFLILPIILISMLPAPSSEAESV